MSKAPNPPSDDFIIICDVEGDPQEVLSGNSSIDHVFEIVGIWDKDCPEYAPHTAWQRNYGGFTRLFETIHKF